MSDLRVKGRTDQPAGGFQHLAHTMQNNSMRQHEFAILLRAVSSRFGPGSVERRTLRIASKTARNKETRLRSLLSNLGWKVCEKPERTRQFLIWFRLARYVPAPVMILLFSLTIAKPIRAHLLDDFYPWTSTHRAKGWTPLPRHPY
jgi:hypothetical protein